MDNILIPIGKYRHDSRVDRLFVDEDEYGEVLVSSDESGVVKILRINYFFLKELINFLIDTSKMQEAFYFYRHKATVDYLLCTKDGRYIVSSSNDWENEKSEIIVYDIKKRKEKFRWEFNYNINKIFITKDNKDIIFSKDGGEVLSCSIKSKEVVSLYKHESSILYLRLAKNINCIASCTEEGEIILYSLDKKEMLYKLFCRLSYDYIKQLFFSKSGRYIVLGTSNGFVYIGDLGKIYHKSGMNITKREAEELFENFIKFKKKYDEDISCLYLNEDANIVVFGAGDGAVKVYNFMNGKLLGEFKHSSSVNRLMLTQDGRCIASAEESDSGNVKVFDIEKNEEVLSVKHEDPVGKFFISSDESKFISIEKYSKVIMIALSADAYFSNKKHILRKKSDKSFKENLLERCQKKQLCDIIIKALK